MIRQLLHGVISVRTGLNKNYSEYHLMSQLTKQIALIERIDQLVRLRATGTPKQLAGRLEISEATLFRIIDTMKELNAPLYYDFGVQSYLYEEETSFKCGFYVRELTEAEQQRMGGGMGFCNLRQLLNF